MDKRARLGKSYAIDEGLGSREGSEGRSSGNRRGKLEMGKEEEEVGKEEGEVGKMTKKRPNKMMQKKLKKMVKEKRIITKSNWLFCIRPLLCLPFF